MDHGEQLPSDNGERPTSERLGEWFGTWRKPLRSWLRDRGSVPPADIDDVAQEVFLRLLRYRDGITIKNPQGYLFRIAANVANEWRDRCRVRRPHDNKWLEELQIDSACEPENAAVKADRDRYVQAVVDALPKRQREFLLLHVNKGMKYKEIAEARGVSYRVVLRELTRSYSALRLRFDTDDI